MKLMGDRQCRRVGNRISEVVLGDERFSPGDERHAGKCLICQAELAHYKTIDRGFASLRDEIANAPPDLVARVMAGLDRVPIPWFRRPLSVSLSAASALAVAATVVLARRRRHAAA
jgi:hypothetical protein